MPKKPGSHHVVPNADGGWDVKKDGATRINKSANLSAPGIRTDEDKTGKRHKEPLV
jgi:hypothetical protein